MKIPKVKIGIKELIVIALSTTLAMITIILAYLFSSYRLLYTIILFFGGFASVIPILILFYSNYRRKKEIEDMFPAFLTDLVEAVRGGFTLTEALKLVSKNDYKSLTPYVRKIAAQIEWGIPIEKILTNFAKEVNSKFISRLVASVIESHRYGGNIVETFDALSSTALEIERLRMERKMYLQTQMITGYVIFFVFLGVVIGLEKFLIPSLQTSIPNVQGFGTPEAIVAEFKIVLRNLIFLQGLFAGLIVGKMSEGSVVAGIKHSVILTFIGVGVYLILA